jgi:LPXTG-motif cell wall-anchored protein
MKRVKQLFALFVLNILSLPFMVKAQDDEGTYIDNLNAQDSSYMEDDLLAGAEQASGSSNNTTVIIIVVAVVVIAAIVFFVMRKKKK